jgi:hypothetical protein
MYGPSPDCKQDFLMEEAVCFYVKAAIWQLGWVWFRDSTAVIVVSFPQLSQIK